MFNSMIFRSVRLAVALILLAHAANSQPNNTAIRTCSQAQTSELSQYEGRFSNDDGLVLVSKISDGELTVRPIVWTSVQILQRVSDDSFGIEGRDDRKISFGRDSTGCVESATIVGFGADGTFKRLGVEKAPIELLLSGQARQAADSIIKTEPKSGEAAVSLARTVMEMVPSKVSQVILFLHALEQQFPNSPAIAAALGDGLVLAGQPDRGQKFLQAAHAVDPANKDAVRGLRLLGILKPCRNEMAAGWTVPFSLEALFSPPTRSEIERAKDDWARRDLSAKDVEVIETRKMEINDMEAEVRVISHSVHGEKNYGAVIIPSAARTGHHPVILDLKGVSPSFFPLELEKLIATRILAERADEFIYFVPSFRGEVLKCAGVNYTSEGDRTDSWDGAADDSLSFLNAALSVTPQADSSRIGVFGKSRGGAVAMLAGIRDKRIRQVVSWSGPVDWFDLMGTAGWPEKAIIADALLKRAEPEENGGQFIRTFLMAAISGRNDLARVRMHMLQSSPLYFADRLPELEAYYGIEDAMVPVRNGVALERAIKGGRSRVVFHSDAGHDLDPKLAFPQSKAFLLKLLSRPGKN
ncbi:MAG: hypothetical protein ABI539_10935 [Acidobacteriota bacterium]